MASGLTVRRPLGTEGREYLASSWAMGHSLSRSLLKSEPFAAGSVFASIPEEITEAQSREFTSGWLHRSSDVGDVHRLMADVLNGLRSTALLVVEDFERHCDDPQWPGADEYEQFCLGGRLVTYGNQSLSTDDVGQILSWTDSNWIHHAAIVEPLVSLNLPKGRAVIDDEVVDQLMAHPKAALARAYDGQGYVVWIADGIDVHTRDTMWDFDGPLAESNSPTTVDTARRSEADTVTAAPFGGANTPAFVQAIGNVLKAAIDALRF
jgi:hypothetical protein